MLRLCYNPGGASHLVRLSKMECSVFEFDRFRAARRVGNALVR